jgi:hypothetical protein
MDSAAYLASIQAQIDSCASIIAEQTTRKTELEELLALLNSSPDLMRAIEITKDQNLL